MENSEDFHLQISRMALFNKCWAKGTEGSGAHLTCHVTLWVGKGTSIERGEGEHSRA